MAHIDIISHQLADLLKRYKADYIEVHMEETESSRMAYRGKNLESVNKGTTVGGNIRALINGGWGFVSFNSFSNLPERIESAVNQAQFIGGEGSKLAEVGPTIDNVPSSSLSNPVSIPLAEKKEILDSYNDIILSTPGIQTSSVGYGDSRKKTIFFNTAGSYIEQERMDVTLRINAVASNGNEVQQCGISVGSRGNFSAIKDLDDQVKETAGKAVSMLSASQVKGNRYTVVLDPILAGVFVHEAFGHLSEADFVYENPQMIELMTLGKVFGRPELNIIDSAVVPNLRGSYKYDDEGVPAVKTYLIQEGKLIGRLHSRETAAKMNEEPTGNARAISYRYPPIVRMSNTYIEQGTTSFKDMIQDIKEGIYVKNWYGGTTSMEMFTFSAGETYMIRDGKIAEMMRPVVLTGNVFETLMNIDAIGNDLDMNQGGGCGKGGQSPLPVSNGSPHIRIQNCLIGGK
jgi:TldD protein